MAQDFGDPNAQSTFEQDLQRARGYKPVTSEDLSKAYAQYDLKTGNVHKSDTDTQLYDKAKTTVLAWWAKQKAQPVGTPPGEGAPSGGDPYGAPYEPVTGGGSSAGGSGTIPKSGSTQTDPGTTAAKAREGGSTTPAPSKVVGTVPKPPATMTNLQVTAVMKTIKGLPASLQASAVPAQYRVSQAALVSYLNMKAKEYQLAVARAAAAKRASILSKQKR